FRAVSSTRRRVGSDTRTWREPPARTAETVILLTPTRCATSLIVAARCLPISCPTLPRFIGKSYSLLYHVLNHFVNSLEDESFSRGSERFSRYMIWLYS